MEARHVESEARSLGYARASAAGPSQPIALVGRKIVVADEARHGVPANRPQGGHPMTSLAFSAGNVSASIIDLRTPSTTSGYVGASTHDEATKELRLRLGGMEERRGGDVEPHGMNRGDSERFDRFRDELPHLLRREEIVARLRAPMEGKIRWPGPRTASVSPGHTGANAKMLSGHGLKSRTFSPPLPPVA